MSATNEKTPADRILDMKNALYGKYYSSVTGRQKFAEEAARMALDMPADDELNIVQNQQKYGIGWKEIAAVGTLLLAGIAGWQLLGADPTTPPQSAPTVPAEDANTQSVVEVDKD